MGSELAVLAPLSERPLNLSIPAPKYVGRPSPRFSLPFTGYRLVPGAPGHRLPIDQVDRPGNARALGEFLTALHAIAPQTAASRGVIAYECPLGEALDKAVSMREVVLARLPGELVAECIPYLEGNCQVPAEAPSRRCLVHGDLVDEHILADERGSLSGVIDWGDAGISDPTCDFGGLYAWLGLRLVEDVLSHYGHPWDTVFLDQIVFRARCFALSAYGWSLLGKATCDADRLVTIYQAFGVKRSGQRRRAGSGD